MMLRAVLLAPLVVAASLGAAFAGSPLNIDMAPATDPAVPVSQMPTMPDVTETPDASAPARLNTRAHLVRHSRPHRRLVKKPSPSDQQVALSLGFKKVSDLTTFPPFYPGLGIVMVKADTLTLGPFRCFDRAGKLVASVYMPTLKEMNDDHKKWDYVHGLPKPVDHVTIYYHPGHPGVATPHYHVVLWHVAQAQESLVAK